VHEYAHHPPPSCPDDSVPIIQEFVCVRLIQSGHYATAIKLDRQFALAATKATAKMRKAIEDRRRMMDEILATMPVVEKNMLELELEQLAQGKSLSSIAASGSGESFSSIGTTDLGMSWEQISPPRPAANTNGSVPPPRSRLYEQPRFGGSPINPLPDRTVAPLSGVGPLFARPIMNGSAPLVPISHGGVDASTSQSRPPMFISSIAQPLASSLSSPHNPLRPPASSAGPSGLKYPPARAVPGLFTTAAPTVTNPSSLFNSVGSANLSRNAFYEPPVTNGVKRPFAQDETHPMPKSATPRVDRDDDINMHSDDDLVRSRHADGPRTNGTDTVPSVPFSIFSQSTKSSRPVVRTENQIKMPPGAFIEDSEEEKEPERTTQHGGRQRTPPRASRPQQPSRAPRSQKLAEETDLGRSLPGTLILEEEEDVAPLPVSTIGKRPSRKGRTSRASSYDEDAGESKQPRRSSRLMTAHSATSLSPEPSPRKVPSKPKKSTRASTVGNAAPPKTGTRKKR
jgi:hypothetical protein